MPPRRQQYTTLRIPTWALEEIKTHLEKVARKRRDIRRLAGPEIPYGVGAHRYRVLSGLWVAFLKLARTASGE